MTYEAQQTDECLDAPSEALPIAAYRYEILDSVAANPATVITAETGAGKSTQVPQYLAEAGYEVVVTQPRRLAARSLAERVSEEVGDELGGIVGYHTAQDKQTSEWTLVTFCTDGLQVVRSLADRQPATGAATKRKVLVIDEVHEWNENIETLVAWARRKTEDDPNFKVVLMSATLEADKLAGFFDDRSGKPIEVPGRTYPVDKRERAVNPAEHAQAVLEETIELAMAGKTTLVFQPGKAEIEKLIGQLKEWGVDATHDLVPLHGDLDKDQQKRAFASGRPKIIVATNIAQTSLTIPDVDAVVDSGLERRKEVHDGNEGLFLAPISQADCLQRAGRAGRTKPGEYVLVGESLVDRPAYPLLEIMRTRLDKTVLRLARNGFDAEELRFFHQPDVQEIRRAKQSLRNLGAMNEHGQVTPLGETMNRLPTEIHFARMLVEAKKLGVAAEVATIVAIAQAGGIRQRKDPAWRALTQEASSDALADLDCFEAARHLTGSEMREAGLHVKAVRQAMQQRRQIAGALGDRRQELNSSNPQTRETIKRAIATGMVEYVYRNNGGNYCNPAQSRQLAHESVVRADGLVVGLPFDLQIPSRRGGSMVLPLLTWAQAVTPADLVRAAPHLVQTKPAEGFWNQLRDETGQAVPTETIYFNGLLIDKRRIAALPENKPEDS
ncbi:MAG: helicase-related protein [Candidatus Saccharimonadales bacterium]